MKPWKNAAKLKNVKLGNGGKNVVCRKRIVYDVFLAFRTIYAYFFDSSTLWKFLFFLY
jgi:hypothetical protein